MGEDDTARIGLLQAEADIVLLSIHTAMIMIISKQMHHAVLLRYRL